MMRLYRCFNLFIYCYISIIQAKRIVPRKEKKEKRHLDSVSNELNVDFDVNSYFQDRQTSDQNDLITNPIPGVDKKDFEEWNMTQHAGLITLDSGDTDRLFYWHFRAEKNPETAPLVIWLNGGPGCTSMQGLFLGISPYLLQKEEKNDTDSSIKIKKNPFSWHQQVNLLFLDQPVGTGLSFTRGNIYRTTEEAIAKDFYEFLYKFFTIKHPEYLSNDVQKTSSRDIYLFGESHAGRFIPQFSDFILQQNAGSPQIHMSLAGIGIGNGWVHPYIQYDYSDFAHGIGLITYGQVRTLKASYTQCQAELEAKHFYTPICFENMDTILENTKKAKGKKLNFYDVRQYVHDIHQEYPPGSNNIIDFMNQKATREVLHAKTSGYFSDCSDEVHGNLIEFDGVSTLNKIESILSKDVQVLFYNGQWDMMCNHFTTEKILLHLDWKGANEYQAAKKYTWNTKGKEEPSGFVQEGGNLTYLVVTNAGHMVPLDVPEVAFDMITRFVKRQSFLDKPQQIKTMRTNLTNLDQLQCDHLTDLNGLLSQKKSLTTSKSSLLSLAIFVAILSALLSSFVTIFCLRNNTGRFRRGRGEGGGYHHAIISERVSDEEEDALEEEKDDEVQEIRRREKNDEESELRAIAVTIRK